MSQLNRYGKRLFIILNLVLGALLANTAHAEITTTYYHTDSLGSVVAASDDTGSLLWRKSYSPYGEKVADGEGDVNAISFTGKQHDDVTGLTYFGARYYDPEVGRFMGMDPVGFRKRNPISFNRYAYANDNPYMFVDPDGKEAVLELGLGAALLVTPLPGARVMAAGIFAAVIVKGDTVNNEGTEGNVRGDNVRSTNDPVDLEEDLAGQEILGDMVDGTGNIEDISSGMSDPRYGPDGNFDKLRGSKEHADGSVTEVHADKNRTTGELSDTKFKTGSDNKKSRDQKED